HANARTLAEGLAELPGVRIDLSRVQTNIVRFDLTGMSAQEFVSACRARGVLGGGGGSSIRFVTHFGIEAADVQRALAVCSDVLSA
ncbi:MAG TPA: threonine aldolase, partial [Candidatus Dormibacteraeota bacterium]